jgi:hypothetical protein
MKLYLTTGIVAKYAGCAPRTVAKWFDSGKLIGWVLPGSGDRRFRPVDVYTFFKTNGIPIPEDLVKYENQAKAEEAGD